MNSNNQNHFSPLVAALIGGVAGALVVFLADGKTREKIMNKFDKILEEGKEKELEFKDKIDKSIISGRKDLAKKIHQVEKQVSET